MMSFSRFADALARWCVIAIAALLPIFVIPVVWVTAAQAKLMLIAALVFVALIAWLIARLIDGYVLVSKDILRIVAALLPIAYGISALVTGSSWTSLVGNAVAQDTVVIICIWYALLLLVSFSLSKNPRSLVNVLRAFIVGGTILCVFQLVRLISPEMTSLGGFLSGNSSSIFGSWHDLGIVVGMLFFLAWALWQTPVVLSNVWRGVLIVLGVSSLILLVVINAADVWYAVGALFLLFGIYRWVFFVRGGLSLSSGAMRSALFIGIALVCAALGYWNAPFYAHVVPARFQVVQLEVRPSWQGTYLVGQQVLSDQKTFLFGSGPNTFTREWGLFKPVGVNQSDFWNVDFNAGVGFIPTTFVTTGLVGVIALALLLLSLLWSIVRVLWGKGDQSVRSTLAAVVAAAGYIAAFQILYVPGIALSALLFLFLGIIVELESADPDRGSFEWGLRAENIGGVIRIIVLVVIIGLLALAPITALRASASDLLVQKAATLYSATSDLQEPLALVQKAISIFPQNDVAHRAAVEVGILQLGKLAASGKNDATAQAELKSQLETTIAHGLSAVSIDSADYQNWLELAYLYQNLAGVGTEGAYQQAKSAYTQSSAKNPTNPLPHLRMAQLAISQGDLDTALDELKTVIALKPNLAAAYYLRSQVEGSQAMYPQGIEDATVAAQLAPQDPTAWYNLGAMFYSAGSYDLARQALEKAVSMQNNYANAIFVLGLSYDKLGRSQDALAAMNAVAQLNPNDATITQVLANLRAGKPALSPPEPEQKPTH